MERTFRTAITVFITIAACLAPFRPLFAQNYVVTDTGISDHGDADIPGSLASVLRRCLIEGGGTISVGSGTFSVITPIELPALCHIHGQGPEATRFRFRSSTADMITVRSRQNSLWANWSIEFLSIELPAGSSGSAIRTYPLQGNNGVIRFVTITGGSPESWAVRMDSAINMTIDHLVYIGPGNGLLWENSFNYALNVGDSAIRNSEFILESPGTIGIRLASPSYSRASSRFRVNNILLSRVEVRSADGTIPPGTIGVHLVNTARITLSHVDIERLETGIVEESRFNNGPESKTNTFIQVFCMGCGQDYRNDGPPSRERTILGGNGYFRDNQSLGSDRLVLDHPIMGRNKAYTGVRDIRPHADPLEPVVLEPIDAGTVFTNKGATGPVTFLLPPANANFSVEYEFHLATTGHPIRIIPAPGDLIRPLQTNTGRPLRSGTGWGHALKIRNIDAATWAVESALGNWSTESD